MSANADSPKPEQIETPEGQDEASAGGAAADQPEADALVELQAQADENWDRYLRAAAEIENVRKRAVRDVENARKFALEGFGRELLAVVDSLEMGLAAENADAQALREGSEATCKLLKTTLERFGVAEVDPEGEPFDPEFHEAMSMMPSDTAEPGSVVNVIQKGYALNGRLLRPAMVIVAADPGEAEAGD
jgi:molecular chaperone GrpE